MFDPVRLAAFDLVGDGCLRLREEGEQMGMVDDDGQPKIRVFDADSDAGPPPRGDLVARLGTPFRDEVQGATTRLFLQAFEKILLGPAGARGMEGEPVPDRPYVAGIEELIERLPTFFNPSHPRQPADFLPWLASWLAFSLRDDLPPESAPKLVASLVARYQVRGQASAIENMLHAYTGLPATVVPDPTEPHCLVITLDFSLFPSNVDQDEFQRRLDIAESLIRREKPAHVRYVLTPTFPSFELGSRELHTSFYTQVGGLDEQGKRVGNMRLGQAQRAPSA